MSLFRNAAIQSGLTLVSRVLGFARDVVLAARIGAGPIGDAFYTALLLPNLFRRIFAEGAFAQAFVPAYARTLESEGQERAQAVASEALSVLFASTAAITLAFQFAMPFVMIPLFYGYRDDPDIFAFAVLLTQITMPYLTCMSLAALFSGVLNTAGRFALSAGAPTLLNLCLLLGALPFVNPMKAALASAFAVLAAGVLQALALYWGCKRQGVVLRVRLPRLTPEVKSMIALAAPGALAASATQINITVSQALASLEEGARSWLNFADRLYQLPLGLVGVAVGVAILPRLARAANADDKAAAQSTIDEGLALAMAFTLPATTALLAMPNFLSDALFVRGAFTSADAAMTAAALFHFAWGVPAFVLVKVLAPPYFARKDTVRPMAFAMTSVAVNLVVGVALFWLFTRAGRPGFPGLAMATSAAAWVNVILLGGYMAAKGWYRPGRAALDRLTRVAVATAIMTALVAAAAINRSTLESWLWGSKELAVGVAILGGAIAYAVAAFATRAVTVADIKGALRKPKAETE